MICEWEKCRKKLFRLSSSNQNIGTYYSTKLIAIIELYNYKTIIKFGSCLEKNVMPQKEKWCNLKKCSLISSS